MQLIADIRRQNLRNLIDNHGGPSAVAKLADINLSFLVQMTGPTPIRPVSEKTARKCELAMGLPAGVMDTPHGVAADPSRARVTAPRPSARVAYSARDNESDAPSAAQAMQVLRMLIEQGAAEGVTISLEKGADIIALALADSANHDNAPRPEYVKSLVRLAK